MQTYTLIALFMATFIAAVNTTGYGRPVSIGYRQKGGGVGGGHYQTPSYLRGDYTVRSKSYTFMGGSNHHGILGLGRQSSSASAGGGSSGSVSFGGGGGGAGSRVNRIVSVVRRVSSVRVISVRRSRSRSRTVIRPRPTTGLSTTAPPTLGPLTTSTPGNWGDWSVCGPCSVSCGSGSCTRTRQCDNPAPGPGGRFCDGQDSDTQQCNGPFQPVNGDWASWQITGQCSKTCGDGTQQRLRTCSNPVPLCGGATCQGLNSGTVTCNYGMCPVNGQWSQWGACSPCSVTCGQGSCVRRRQCNNPTPANGGSACQGPNQRSEQCTVLPLRADGVLTQWTQWTPCSASCNSGQQSRRRSCSPSPACGGYACIGPLLETRTCNQQNCVTPSTGPQTTVPEPVNGQWSQWGACFPCSVTCGQGTCVRRRQCNNPTPANGGSVCQGPNQMSEQCTVLPLRADGVLTQWTQWTPCSASCNGGQQSRRRICSPSPACGGHPCSGPFLETRTCNQQTCGKKYY